MPDYLPMDGNPNWWEAGPWPPPLHQPSRAMLSPNLAILREAQEVVRLIGLTPATERGPLLSQMDELTQQVGGFRFQHALKDLRERG